MLYSTTQVARALQIPRERLQDWVNREYIFAEQPATGKGVKSKFSLWFIFGIALFKHLNEFGVERGVASAYFEEWVTDEFREKYSANNGTKIVTADGAPAQYAIIDIRRQKPPAGHKDNRVIIHPAWAYNTDIQLVGDIESLDLSRYLKECGLFYEVRIINLRQIIDEIEMG